MRHYRLTELISLSPSWKSNVRRVQWFSIGGDAGIRLVISRLSFVMRRFASLCPASVSSRRSQVAKLAS